MSTYFCFLFFARLSSVSQESFFDLFSPLLPPAVTSNTVIISGYFTHPSSLAVVGRALFSIFSPSWYPEQSKTTQNDGEWGMDGGFKKIKIKMWGQINMNKKKY
jgi:hypothetical protein